MLVLAVAGALVVAPGCGSSTPSYCSDRTTLESSVKGLADVNLQSGGVSALQSQLRKVESNAKSLVDSAKSDFPSQTSEIDSSLSTLTNAVDGLSASPTPQQLAGLVPDIQRVASSVKSFTDATSSKCS